MNRFWWCLLAPIMTSACDAGSASVPRASLCGDGCVPGHCIESYEAPAPAFPPSSGIILEQLSACDDVIAFDAEGNGVEYSCFGELATVEWNDRGQAVFMRINRSDALESLVETIEQEFDTNGLLANLRISLLLQGEHARSALFSFFIQDRVLTSMKYRLDDDGRLGELFLDVDYLSSFNFFTDSRFRSDSGLALAETTTWTTDGNQIGFERAAGPDETVVSSKAYEYDVNDRLISVIHRTFDPIGPIPEGCVSFEDESVVCTDDLKYDGNELTSVTIAGTHTAISSKCCTETQCGDR